MSTSPTQLQIEALAKSRGWLIAGGILSLLVGFVSIVSPEIATIAIVQFLAVLLLVSGVVSLCLAIFGKHDTHRFAHAIFAVLRILVGAILLVHIVVSILAVTILLAAVFIVEGIFSIAAAFRLRGHGGWVYLLFSGLAAILLSVMLYVHFPSTAAWAIGMLFGINAIFGGMSLLMLGLGVAQPATPPAS